MTPIKSIVITLFACVFLSFSSISLAEEHPEQASYGKKIGDKTLRGLSNISVGFLEVPKNIINISNESNFIFGATAGLLLGTINTFGRLSVGVCDLITFPFPTKPIVHPVHPWENFLGIETEYHNLFAPDL